MNNKLTLTELLAKRICESDSQNVTEDFAEELATVIYEEYQEEVDMTDSEWNRLLGKLGEYIEEFLIDDAKKLANDWSEDEAFENRDSLIKGKFNSSDLYGKLEKDHTYMCKVYGWRVQFLSLYRNIVKCKEAE